MAYTGHMHVLKCVHKLMKIGACDVLFEAASVCNEVKQFTTLGKFQNDVVNLSIKFASILLLDHVIPNFNQIDNMVMMKFLEYVDFILHEFFICLAFVKDLDCITVSVCCITSKFDFAADSSSESFSELIFSECVWH